MKRRWTEKEIKYLKDNYKMMFYCDIANMLKRTNYAIRKKSYNIGLRPPNKMFLRDQSKVNNPKLTLG